MSDFRQQLQRLIFKHWPEIERMCQKNGGSRFEEMSLLVYSWDTDPEFCVNHSVFLGTEQRFGPHSGNPQLCGSEAFLRDFTGMRLPKGYYDADTRREGDSPSGDLYLEMHFSPPSYHEIATLFETPSEWS